MDNRITLQKLEILCMVVRYGTVTRAAEVLFVAQPVVTAHLRSLEQRLGIKLFERRGRTLELTEAGRCVHRWAEFTLQRGGQVVQDVQRLRAGELGTVRVGASMSLGSYRLPMILSEFQRSRPSVKISLLTSNPETAMREVERENLDFCVVVLQEAPANAVLEAEIMGREELVLVTAPDGPVVADIIEPKELSSLPFVGPPRGSMQSTLLDTALGRYGLSGRPSVIELGHPEAIKAAVLAGAGASLLFRCSVTEELTEGLLREVQIRGVTLEAPVYGVKRRDHRLSQSQQCVRQQIANALGAAPASARDRTAPRFCGDVP